MRMAGKFNSSSYPVEAYLLTLIDRSFGGSTRDLGIFSSEDSIESYVERKYSQRYMIKKLSNGFLLSDSMTEIVLLVQKFVMDERA